MPWIIGKNANKTKFKFLKIGNELYICFADNYFMYLVTEKIK